MVTLLRGWETKQSISRAGVRASKDLHHKKVSNDTSGETNKSRHKKLQVTGGRVAMTRTVIK